MSHRHTVRLTKRLTGASLVPPGDWFPVEKRLATVVPKQSCRHLQSQRATTAPLRKQLNNDLKRQRKEARSQKLSAEVDRLQAWELTVGIEVHARLNTTCKLFSPASADSTRPNADVALFDVAFPGSQPQFQQAALVPAIRAALALDCKVQKRSSWDRKHYFYQDQPNGYQITQYYEPLALDGTLSVDGGDGRPPLHIGIKQVQLEQDTAKTTQQQGSDSYLIDYSRVGAPLIEIITLPHIHSPSAAAATVRAIRDLLRLVGACTGNMEDGDLRADVNVSVTRRGETRPGTGHSYAGVTGLGTRTEIKNLNSFKSVEDAVTAERDRQIGVLEAGGEIFGETRGWTIGGSETTRLRGKEGEVDYRYMPDPDLAPVYISERLVHDLQSTLPEPSQATLARIVEDFGISTKDANTLMSLDDGERLEFAAEVKKILAESEGAMFPMTAKTAANWTLHELGGLVATANQEWGALHVSPLHLASIIRHLLHRQITGRSAKHLLSTFFDGRNEGRSVEEEIESGGHMLRPMRDAEYEQLAVQILKEHSDAVAAVKNKGQKGKIMFFVGQMMRRADEGTVEADKAKSVIERLLGM